MKKVFLFLVITLLLAAPAVGSPWNKLTCSVDAWGFQNGEFRISADKCVGIGFIEYNTVALLFPGDPSFHYNVIVLDGYYSGMKEFQVAFDGISFTGENYIISVSSYKILPAVQ